MQSGKNKTDSVFSTFFVPLQLDNPKKILAWSIYFIVLFCSVDAFLNAIWLVFFGKQNLALLLFSYYQDLFADTFKVAFSIPDVWHNFVTTNEFRHLPQVVQNYLINNPYFGIAGLPLPGEPATHITHFHLPPSYLCLTIGITSLLKAGLRLWPTVLLVYFFYIFLTAFFLKYTVYKENTHFSGIQAAILAGISYPALLALQRGNFTALYTCMGIILFLLYAWHSSKISFIPYFLMACVIAIRPTACIVTAILPIKYGFKKSFFRLFILAAGSILIELGAFLLISKIYSDYTILNIQQGLDIYRQLYTMNVYNSLTSSSIMNFFHTLFPSISDKLKYTLFLSFSTIITITCLFGYIKKVNTYIWPFILTSLCTLITPVTAPYHLTVFIAPLIHSCFDTQSSPKIRKVIIIISLLMLSSKVLFLFSHYELQGILNPLLLAGGILYLIFYSISKKTTSQCGS